MYCVDIGESFHMSIYFQNLASIQPRTSPVKFARSPSTAHYFYYFYCRSSRLLLQRFSAERYGYSGDTFCGGLAVFRLDWKNPVNMPPEMEECSVHKFEWTKCRILDREDVVAAKVQLSSGLVAPAAI